MSLNLIDMRKNTAHSYALAITFGSRGILASIVYLGWEGEGKKKMNQWVFIWIFLSLVPIYILGRWVFIQGLGAISLPPWMP